MSHNVASTTLGHIKSQGNVERGDCIPLSKGHLPLSLVACRVGILLRRVSNNGVITFLIQKVFPLVGVEGGINYDDPLGFIGFNLM